MAKKGGVPAVVPCLPTLVSLSRGLGDAEFLPPLGNELHFRLKAYKKETFTQVKAFVLTLSCDP